MSTTGQPKFEKFSNKFNRRFTNEYKRLPYISGYFYVFFDLPLVIDSTNRESAENALNACCTGITLPSGTLNRVTLQGLGGIKYSHPASIDYGDTLSIKFVEHSGTPIYRIITEWFNKIRNSLTGIQEKDDVYGNVWFAATKPNGIDIEYGALFTEVYPLKDPTDIFNSDIATFDKATVELDFNFNMFYDTINKNDNMKPSVDVNSTVLTVMDRVFGTNITNPLQSISNAIGNELEKRIADANSSSVRKTIKNYSPGWFD